jgi:LPXTG-site transpeptidase (sortase) family protein
MGVSKMSSRRRLPRDRRAWVVVGLVVVGLALVLWAVLPGGSPITGSDTQETSVGDELPHTPARGPDQILVPSIKIKAPLQPIELASDGVLTPPADTDVVGWWDGSAEPGSRKGQTVVTGHTVSTGGGVMNDLPTIDVGALVRIRDEGALTDYRVTGVMKLTKEQVAERSQSLFGQARRHGGQLVMVTCTDYHDGEYDSNIIAWAEPVENDAA